MDQRENMREIIMPHLEVHLIHSEVKKGDMILKGNIKRAIIGTISR